MKEIFIKWLKHNNCYEQFMFNFKDWHRCISLDEYVNRNSYNYANFIFYSFNWKKTTEGGDYWNKLDDNWRKFYCNNIKTICKLEKLN